MGVGNMRNGIMQREVVEGVKLKNVELEDSKKRQRLELK
jgi:hypothetical protein